MKRLLTLLIILATATAAAAQDVQPFSRLSAAPTVGLDGVGISIATTLTPVLQLRAGYSLVPYRYVGLPGAIPSEVEIAGQTRQVRGAASLKVTAHTGGGHLLADLFVLPSSSFHFTAGLFYDSPNYLDADLDASSVLPPDEYASYGVLVNPDDYRTNITSDTRGHVHAALRYNAVKPYLGIGFGRAVTSRRVSVTFDIGALYAGKPCLQSYDYSLNKDGAPVRITSETLDANPDLDGLNDALALIEKIRVLPMLKLNVFIKIF